MNDNVKVLALSSSREGNSGYLEMAVPVIKTFLGDKPVTIGFIPFASVGPAEEFLEKVKQALNVLPYEIILIHGDTARENLERAEVIMTGGGNTFKLLHDLYAYDLVEIIKEQIHSGKPYIGWSAGANILGLTIGTTNDMPIIEPLSFKALGIFPFQVNPHYYNDKPVGHNGESRDDRLKEYVLLNENVHVVCLPEGNGLWLEKERLEIFGKNEILVWSCENGQPIKEFIKSGKNIYYKFWKVGSPRT